MSSLNDMSGPESETPMVLGNCPACKGLMRVPVTTASSVIAKCPHCQHQFPIQQAISSAIPAAEIVSNPLQDRQEIVPHADKPSLGKNDSDAPRTKFDVPKQLYDGARRRRRRSKTSKSTPKKESWSRVSRPADSAPADSQSADSTLTNGTGKPHNQTAKSSLKSAFTNEGQVTSIGSNAEKSPSPSPQEPERSSETAVIEKTPRPPSHRVASDSSTRRSPSSRSRSPNHDEEDEETIGEWLRIAVGGAIAFPLAYLGLMWLAGIDPFFMSSTLESVSPALVPPSLRSETESPQDDTEVDQVTPFLNFDSDDSEAPDVLGSLGGLDG